MAKKIKVKLILELRAAGMLRNLISSTRHMSKTSVSDVFHHADEMSISYDSIREKDEEDVYRMFYPDKHSVENMQEKHNSKVQRLIKLSKFRLGKAEINDIYYVERGINRQTIQELATNMLKKLFR